MQRNCGKALILKFLFRLHLISSCISRSKSTNLHWCHHRNTILQHLGIVSLYFVAQYSSLLFPKVYYCRSLAIVFIEQTVLQRYHDYTHDPNIPSTLQPVLKNLSALYGLWSLSKHLAVLYQGETTPWVHCACHFIIALM